MAKHITRWSPDTCSCVLEYEWDDTTSEDERVHTFNNLVQKCDSHTGIVVHAETYDHVLKENQTKNKIINAVFAKVPRLKHEQIDANGNKNTILHPSVNYKWQFSGKNYTRSLQVQLENANLTPQERADLEKEVALLDKPVTIL